MHRSLIALTLALALGACAAIKDSDPSQWSAEKFYRQAQQALTARDYPLAIEHLENLEIRHPFSPYTQQGNLEIAYAYYKYDEPDSAIAAADRFIKLYPRHPNVDYAYYIRGLANFDRGATAIRAWLGLDTTNQDASPALQSFRSFEQLIKLFPDSRYTADARTRMVHLRNNLAQYELHVADYYMRRNAYLAAANRAKYVLENYPQTPAVTEALAIMIEAYEKLGVDDLAEDARRVLELNAVDRKTSAFNIDDN